jgi:diguanylate cyclase (GGDEF)-like protein
VEQVGGARGQHLWFKTKIFLPATADPRSLGLEFVRIHDVDEVLVNGERIGGSGTFPPHFVDATVYERVYEIPEVLLLRDGWNEILVHTYNDDRHGGIVWRAPVLGFYDELLWRSALRTYGVVAFAVFFAMIGVNHLLLFFFLPHPATRSNLLFALFALTSALYLVTYSPALGPRLLGLETVHRIQLTVLPLNVMLLTTFIFAFFERKLPLILRLACIVLGALAVIPAVGWLDLARHLHLPVITVVFSLAAVIAGRLVAGCVRRGTPHAASIGLVSSILAAAGLWDLGSHLLLLPLAPVSVSGLVFPIGFVPFYVVMGLILAMRYREYYTNSTVDRLTGLMQRHFFLDRLTEEVERAWRTGGTLVVAMLDLDGFKEVNDALSHSAGDRVLAGVAGQVKAVVRPFDLVGRFGGDELCAAMVVGSSREGLAMLERIRAAIAAQRFEVGSQEVGVTVSIGASASALTGTVPASRLLEVADQALYRAKAAGGDQVVLDRSAVPETQ